MIRLFHSVMEIKRQINWAPILNTNSAKYYEETITYDISGQMLHRLEFNWFKPELFLEIFLYTALFFIPAGAFLLVPIFLIIGLIFSSKNFELLLCILGIVSFIASFWFSFYFVVEKKEKALVRKDRCLHKKETKFAIVQEKYWAKWLLKLKTSNKKTR